MSEAVQLPIPAKLAPLFTATDKRYRCSHGGRGSAKTRTFAMMTAVKAYQAMMNGETGLILCAREFMNSLEESSMQEVKQAILSVPWLAANFDIGEKYIRTIDKSVNVTPWAARGRRIQTFRPLRYLARYRRAWGYGITATSRFFIAAMPVSQIFQRLLHIRAGFDQAEQQFIHRRTHLVHRPVDIDKQHRTQLVGVVADLVLVGIIKQNHLALIPVQDLIVNADPQPFPILWHDQPQCARTTARVGPLWGTM